MAEPASSTAGVTIAATTVSVTGAFFGAQYDMLLWGFVGGLVSLSYLPPMSPAKIAGTVAGSTLLAGFLAPVVAAGALHYLPWLGSVSDVTRIAAAGCLGLAAQALVPAALKRLSKWLGGK